MPYLALFKRPDGIRFAWGNPERPGRFARQHVPCVAGAGKIDLAGQFQKLKRMRYRNSSQDQFASSVESMNGLLRVLQTI